MTKILEFSLGSADRARLKLRISGRERPDFTDGDDRNWLQAVVEVRSGRMAGAIACSLRTEDIGDFRSGLARMTDAGDAFGEFKTMEDRLAIKVERSASGRLTVTGHISERPDGDRLSFRFATATDGIPMMLQDLDEILDEYPITES